MSGSKRSQGGRGHHAQQGLGQRFIRRRTQDRDIAERMAPIEEAISIILGLTNEEPVRLAEQVRPIGITRTDRTAAIQRMQTAIAVLQQALDTLEASPEIVIAGPFDEVVVGNWDGAMKVVDVQAISHVWHGLFCGARSGHDFDDPVDDLPALRFFDNIRRPSFSVIERPDVAYVGMRHHPRMFNRASAAGAGRGVVRGVA